MVSRGRRTSGSWRYLYRVLRPIEPSSTICSSTEQCHFSIRLKKNFSATCPALVDSRSRAGALRCAVAIMVSSPLVDLTSMLVFIWTWCNGRVITRAIVASTARNLSSIVREEACRTPWLALTSAQTTNGPATWVPWRTHADSQSCPRRHRGTPYPGGHGRQWLRQDRDQPGRGQRACLAAYRSRPFPSRGQRRADARRHCPHR